MKRRLCSEDGIDETRALLQSIDLIDRLGQPDWLQSLPLRKRRELEFHNRDRDAEFVRRAQADPRLYDRFYGNRKYYGVTRRSQAYVLDWIERHAAERVFLDYGCGDGSKARIAARAGAHLSLGLDISDISIRNCQRRAKDEGLTGVRFFQADAEQTGLPDGCVDAVLCSGMLHHVDLSHALPELRRVLKPGGVALAVEALNYNPAIKLYRWLTPAMRTAWEKRHILGLKDVRFASRYFDIAEIRYWHVVGYAGGKYSAIAGLLDRTDRLLEKIPYLNRLAWIFTFEMRKAG